MKIIHTSDIHLASPLSTRLSSDKVKERKRELLLSFRRMVEEAKGSGADAFIIAGDLFDSERIARSVIADVLAIIASVPDITFFYLYGNHEKALIESCGVKIPDNLKPFGKEWTYYTLGGVNIIGRTECARGMFADIRLEKGERNIVVLHGELRDRSDADGAIGEKELCEVPIDYLALGHYHTYAKNEINHRTVAVYPGIPEGRGFDETGDKGYVEISISSSEITHRFIKSAKRTLRIVEADVSGLVRTVDIENAISAQLLNIPSTDMVRAVLVGTHEPGQKIDEAAILARFGDRFYYFELKDKTKTRISPDDYKNDKSLKGEFIRGVLSDENLTDKQKERVIDMGLMVLMNEEI